MTPKEALHGSSLFSHLSPKELDEVATIITEREVPSGSELIREGEEAYSLFILEEGHVDVLRDGDLGSKMRITELASGTMFGEMSFVGHESAVAKTAGTAELAGASHHPLRSAGVVAHGKVKVLELRYDSLEKLAEIDPVLGVKLYRALATSLNDKLVGTTDHLLPLIASARLSALGQMTANIAHELNNPLSVLRLMVGNMTFQATGDEEGGANPALADWAAKIGNTVDRIVRIISGLRAVSRDGARDPMATADLCQIARETLDFCEQRLRDFEIEIRLELPAHAVPVRCRAVQISQALLNLLNNSADALTAMPKPAIRWVRVAIEETGTQAVLTVSDSGPGILPAIAKRVFKPFYTTKSPGEGTGLGLSISRSLVQENGGTLTLDENARNTTFEIRLER